MVQIVIVCTTKQTQLNLNLPKKGNQTMINAIKLSLYSKLTPAQRNDVRTLIAVMDCEKKAGILSCLTELIGANDEQIPQQAMNCLTELVSQLVLECEHYEIGRASCRERV